MVNHGALGCVQGRRVHRHRRGAHQSVRAGGIPPCRPARRRRGYLPLERSREWGRDGREGGAHVDRRSWWGC
ncbi:hypothetical protein T261_2868 [Streptomyces lydicus]|nr:hypothetical protein T261_2868 [Streptomyces lydicus]